MPQRTRVDSFSRVDTRHDVMGDVTTHYVLIRLPRPTLFDPFILTRFESPKKKKKKEKGLTKLNFEFDQKVKISKMGLSYSVFRVHSNFGIRFFIRDSEIVQMAQFLKNFRNEPVPFSFLSTFWFWDPFLHSRLGNCANCPISRKLTFAQILTKSQNFQEGLVLHNFSCRFRFWGLFLHSTIQNCSNSVILQLLALMWTLTKNQDVQAKLVLFKFSHRFWLWNPLICFGLGNHLCDPLLWSTSSVQNLSSQDQDLRFIHLVRIPSGLFSRLHQGFPFKVQMKSHKCILNLKLHWVTSSTYHSCSVLTSLQPTIPLSVPNIPTYRSVPTSRESTILTKNS